MTDLENVAWGVFTKVVLQLALQWPLIMPCDSGVPPKQHSSVDMVGVGGELAVAMGYSSQVKHPFNREINTYIYMQLYIQYIQLYHKTNRRNIYIYKHPKPSLKYLLYSSTHWQCLYNIGIRKEP